jgi:hypothetical protein
VFSFVCAAFEAVTVAMQLPSQERITGNFDVTMSLWQILGEVFFFFSWGGCGSIQLVLIRMLIFM